MAGKWRIYWTDEDDKIHWVGGFRTREAAERQVALLLEAVRKGIPKVVTWSIRNN